MKQDRGLMDREDVVTEYRPLLYRVCLGILGNAEDAEDATQESLLRIDRGLAGFRGDASLKTWVVTVARRCCFSRLFDRKRLPREESWAAELPGADALSDLDEEMAYWDLVRETERRGKTGKPGWDALDRAIWRSIAVNVFAGEEPSWREIGQALGKSENTVKYRIYLHIRPVFLAVCRSPARGWRKRGPGVQLPSPRSPTN